MKKKGIIIVVISIIVVILLIVGLYFYGLTSVSKKEEKVTFNIAANTSTKEILNNLYKARLIKSKISSMIYVKLNSDIVIKAGTYELDRSYDTKKILEILSDGYVINDTVSVTFIEGKRITNYVSIISEKFGYSENEILDVMNDSNYLKELINKYDFLDERILNSDIYYPLEGYLFPATYEFYEDASIKGIIEKMLDKTKNVLDNYSNLIGASDYNIHEILTMASIIENETMIADQRDEVSQVIYKRLDLNMSLGMDVTTYYGVQKALSENLTKSDLNSVNAYNTRRTDFLGLPIGPICNPSEASIRAALKPSDTNYLYFYADIKTGELHFAKTYNEFQNLIQKYS
ncbi:MAG: endolytic transglycosylase MltG [Firmicutes bacterium]|nr:endolytic transglycosylase MltG [Bacillota bacterium]